MADSYGNRYIIGSYRTIEFENWLANAQCSYMEKKVRLKGEGLVVLHVYLPIVQAKRLENETSHRITFETVVVTVGACDSIQASYDPRRQGPPDPRHWNHRCQHVGASKQG